MGKTPNLSNITFRFTFRYIFQNLMGPQIFAISYIGSNSVILFHPLLPSRPLKTRVPKCITAHCLIAASAIPGGCFYFYRLTDFCFVLP